jgi:predicted DNA-binding transcriptional regulator AlpA
MGPQLHADLERAYGHALGPPVAQTSAAAQSPESDLMLEPEVKALTRLHYVTRWRLAKKGLFPQSFRLGDPDAKFGGRIAWSRREIMAWIEARMDARKAKIKTA